MPQSQLRARKEFCFQSSERDWIVVAYTIRGACIQLDRQFHLHHLCCTCHHPFAKCRQSSVDNKSDSKVWRAGTSHAIADFYKEIFHARVEAPTAGESVVYVGPGTKFRFTENQALGPVTNKVAFCLD